MREGLLPVSAKREQGYLTFRVAGAIQCFRAPIRGTEMRRLRTTNRRRARIATKLQAMTAERRPGLEWLATAAISRPESPVHGRYPAPRIRIVGKAAIPGGGELELAECGGRYSIQFCADELMGNSDHVSEEALASLTRVRLAAGVGPVLVGGLGMGFTLRAALDAWSPPAPVIVAELVPGVVEWAKGELSPLFGGSLNDPRVSILTRDVHDVIVEADRAFEAILLDVDNGPDGFMRVENDRLYCDWGLRAAFMALKPGGILAVWSAYPEPDFPGRLARVGFAVEELALPAFIGSHDKDHTIWFATKPREGS